MNGTHHLVSIGLPTVYFGKSRNFNSFFLCLSSFYGSRTITRSQCPYRSPIFQLFWKWVGGTIRAIMRRLWAEARCSTSSAVMAGKTVGARGARAVKKKVTAEPIGDLFSILRFVYVYYEALSQLNRQLEARLIRSRNKFEPPTFFCARRDSNRLLDPPLRQFVSFYFETNEIAGEMKKKRLRIIHPLIEIWPKRNRHCKKDKGNRKTLMSPRIFRVLLVCLQLYCLILSRGKSATMKRVFSRRVESSNPTGSFNIQ